MGTPVTEDDPVWGPDCALFLPTSQTPASIYLYFYDIESCPARPVCPYNNHLLHLQQNAGNPCRWDYSNPVTNWKATVLYQAFLPRTQLTLRYDNTEFYFKGTMPGIAFEHQVLPNNIVACAAHDWGKNGSVLFLWKKAAAGLVSALGLDFSSQILMEVFVADGDLVYKFCNSNRDFNVMVRVTP